MARERQIRRSDVRYSAELIEKLDQIARRIRRNTVASVGAGVAGHTDGSCSTADLVTAIYFYKMRHDPFNPAKKDRDRSLPSRGHVAILQYAALAEAGYFPIEDLRTAKEIGLYLQGHPDMRKIPGIEAGTGSLGQGVSIRLGMALDLKVDKLDSRVYVLRGDGEMVEGQIREAVMAASVYRVDNLVVLVDKNGLRATGGTKDRFDTDPLPDKWRSFGWSMLEIDGHRMEEVLAALDMADFMEGKPTVIITRTVKGKGISFAEHVAGFRNGILTEKNYKKALNGLPQGVLKWAIKIKELRAAARWLKKEERMTG